MHHLIGADVLLKSGPCLSAVFTCYLRGPCLSPLECRAACMAPFTYPTSPRATVYGYIAYGCTAYSYFLLLAYPGADVLLKTLSGFSDIASIYSAGYSKL